MTTTNTELRDFQRTVRDQAKAIAGQVFGGDTYVNRFLEAVGLADFVDDIQVTVTVTVPAANETAAVTAVQDQLSSIYLPSGWAAEVTA